VRGTNQKAHSDRFKTLNKEGMIDLHVQNFIMESSALLKYKLSVKFTDLRVAPYLFLVILMRAKAPDTAGCRLGPRQPDT